MGWAGTKTKPQVAWCPGRASGGPPTSIGIQGPEAGSARPLPLGEAQAEGLPSPLPFTLQLTGPISTTREG